MDATPSSPANEVPAKTSAETRKASEEKWGKEVLDIGFNFVPALLLRAQRRLRISPIQLAVLLQLIDYWWDANRPPYPSRRALAERLDLSPRQLSRHLDALEEMGFLKKIPRKSPQKGTQSNAYDLSGLVQHLKTLAPEFKKAEEQAREARRSVSRRGKRS
jgi:DNA-binding transcriptional ArsR family regulator